VQINQLRYFVHVAELGSFSRAATHLNVAQPALSRQIGLLEQELRVKLLYRHGRGVKLTGPGTELLNRAVSLLQQVQEARDAVMGDGPRIEGLVRIGLPTWAAQMLLPTALLRCRREHPLLSISVFESSSVSILEEWLLSGRIDLAVVGTSPLLSRNLTTVPLLRQTIMLVGRGARDLSGTGDYPFSTLASLPLILSPPGHGVREALDIAARECGMLLRPEMEVDSFAVAKELVMQGFGYALLPGEVVRNEVAAGSLWCRDLCLPRVERELLLASSVERPLTSSGRVLQKLLLEVAANSLAPRQSEPQRSISRGSMTPVPYSRHHPGTLPQQSS
jgi:LysR family nitrogen assimilation transcriptional regulator